MFVRVLTSVIGIPVVVALVALGSPVLNGAGLIIGLIGLYEYFRSIKKKYNPIEWLGYSALIVYFVGMNKVMEHFMTFSVVLMMLLLICMVFTYPKYTISDIGVSYFGPLYVGILLSYIILIRGLDHGAFYVGLLFISGWGSDSCAYFAGRYFGAHKLAPVLSPKKTVEGAIGGAIGACLLGILFALGYHYFIGTFSMQDFIVIGSITFIGALLSQLGDLAASAIKRHVQTKDFGNLFPGHGGVLDRFDSILFVSPFIYYAIALWQ